MLLECVAKRRQALISFAISIWLDPSFIIIIIIFYYDIYGFKFKLLYKKIVALATDNFGRCGYPNLQCTCWCGNIAGNRPFAQ